MPTADWLSRGGLRYTRFHTAALCAPTRQSLLTGRNPHTAAMGGIPETATSEPGYSSIRPESIAPLARVLSLKGYATGAFGKMHQTPAWEITPSGPFTRWPTGEGFDRFYGFLGAESDHFTPPDLIDGTTQVQPPKSAEEGYHLSEDLVDQAISWMSTLNTLEPDRPWFCYLSYGACHAPLHVPESWRDRYRGRFDHGWDEERKRTFARQRALGLVPADAELPAWPEGVPSWATLSDAQRRVSARLMETFAAFAEHTDAQTGRLIEHLEATGALDNTIVFYLLGDNGPSPEGGLEGTINEALAVNGFTDTAERMLPYLDEIGGPTTYPQYPVGWALATSTPYQWTKQVASHYGGTRNGMIVHWPSKIPDAGGLRHQWHHVVDVAPTILEAANLSMPPVVDGIEQIPLEGVSFAYTFTEPDAPERHTTQYFEALGNRGIYHKGWTAVTKHRTPWLMSGATLPRFEDDVWELYDTTSDWTQAKDLSAQYPERLQDLQQMFQAEASKHNVLPLDDRLIERFNAALVGRRDLFAGRSSVTLPGNLPRLRENAAPNLKNTSFTLTIDLELSPEAEGVLVAQGGRFGGWSLYVHDGRLHYCYNLCGIDITYVRSSVLESFGRSTATLDFVYDGQGVGKGGDVVLGLHGRPIGEGRIPRTTAYIFSQDETFDIGMDRGTPVTEEYGDMSANKYTGAIHTVRVDFGDDSLAPSVSEQIGAALITH